MSSLELFKFFCSVFHTGYQGGVAHFRERLSLKKHYDVQSDSKIDYDRSASLSKVACRRTLNAHIVADMTTEVKVLLTWNTWKVPSTYLAHT